MTLGAFYEQQRRWPDAEKQFQTAIQVAPKDPLPRAALASLYRSEGKEELAEKVLTEAKLQLSSDPNAYRLLGDYYVSQGDTSRALAEFASLTQEHPKDLNVRKSYIQLLILAGSIPEASKQSDEILQNSPQDAEALILKGEILLRQKNNRGSLVHPAAGRKGCSGQSRRPLPIGFGSPSQRQRKSGVRPMEESRTVAPHFG